jgi:hypothetical protein
MRSAGSPDDSGSGAQPGARRGDSRVQQQFQFVSGISHRVCRCVDCVGVCCIDHIGGCPDQGGLGGVLQRHDAGREEDRAAAERQKYAAIIQAQAASGLAQSASAKVTAVHVISATQATVTYDIYLGGKPALSNQTGTAVYQDGT